MIAAIVLYVLGMPLAGIVCSASLNADQNRVRGRLGMPPMKHSGIDNAAIVLVTLGWPILGVVAIAGILFNTAKGKTSGKA